MSGYLKKYFLRYEVIVVALPIITILFWPHLLPNLFTSTYMPHGHCYLWMPELVWLHISSDFVIGVSYIFISVALGFLVYKASRDIPFHRMFLAFGLFIVACGFTHLMAVWNVYEAIYWLSGSVKVITAAASLLTAITLPYFIPRALKLVNAAKISNERKVELENANIELKHLNNKLKELDEIKTNFFTNVSHELRTPLALILGPAEKLLGSPEISETHKKDLSTIQQNGKALLKHVNELLDLAKLESGKLKLDYTSFDLVKLVQVTASYFSSMINDQEIKLNIYAANNIQVNADAEKIERVIINILSNALKFTPPKGKISFKLDRVNDSAIIELTDSGPGLDEETIKTMFQPFSSKGDSSKLLGSTGLGLSIVKEFIELHGGTVEAKNSAEGGAILKLAIPIQPKDNVTVGSVVQEVEKTKEDDLNISAKADTKENLVNRMFSKDNPTLLLAEDNLEMNQFISDTLSDQYNVYSVFDGKAALDKVQTIMPDIIITDVMMPKLSGDKLVREIRRNKNLDKIPIILLSANADEELRINLLKNGAQDYLTKPFTIEELKARISNAVNMKIARDVLQKELNSRLEDVSELASELAKRKQALESSLQEKEVMLKEIHHRVKNNLQVISSLLNLQSNYIKDDSTLSILNDSRDRVRSMSLVHERLYQSDNLAQINFSEYIKDIAAYLFSVYRISTNHISFVNESENIGISIEQGIPLGLIINEVLTNTLKHAFEDNSLPGNYIYVSLKQDETSHKILIIRDNGKGLPDDAVLDETESLGFQLIRTLVSQIEGTLEINRKDGTEFKITFK